MAHHREHIVLFPYMAQGHIIPFMALARLLQQKTNYTITFVNTPCNIQTLQSTLPTTSTIRLVSLPFNGSDHGLPPNVESAEALPFIRVVDLFKASETLQASFESLISTICEEDGGLLLCIISDMFLGWTVEVANKLGVFHSVFIASGAYGTVVFFSLWLHVPLSQTSEMESGKFLLPDFPEANLIEDSQIPENPRTVDRKDP
ncbi:UDP-glycosyltransferase 92A1 [Cinnamomum micranthum f. kanehirae]|uniref:UDP-glycosyltransferase 92A1 n=1 Tax=Cinnamomum micranthum f. kanehirae TaxID=337451 RepID=A0A443PE06_9MAGN|nr:UDP-glycosyltransferase 92A1 [Cinnamomum micranthum f. kanehirae]